jgi:uncharacterized membrane protein YphA (DoxX/SURF4 family)
MINSLLARIGTLLYALILAIFGTFHFLHASGMAKMVPTFFPGAVFWVYLAGTGLILAAISFVIGKYTKIAGILLGIMLLIFALTIHLPHHLNGDSSALAMVLKDTGLAGCAFILASRGK